MMPTSSSRRSSSRRRRSKNIVLLGALAFQIVAISAAAAANSAAVSSSQTIATTSSKQKQQQTANGSGHHADQNGRRSRLTERRQKAAAGELQPAPPPPPSSSDLNEFRARTMLVMNSQAVGNDRQRPAEIRRQDGGHSHEQWNGPGGPMVPTFTDQEQGDEMVALASDHSSAPSHQLDHASQADHLLVDHQQQQQQQQQAKRPTSSKGGLSREKFLVPAAAAAEGKLLRLNNLQDEYEDDEEAADEPEPSAATAVTSARLAGLTSSAGSQLATDYEPPMGQQLQQLQQQQLTRERNQRAKEASGGGAGGGQSASASASNKFRPLPAAGALHYTDYVPAAQYGAGLSESKPVNRSVAQGERIRTVAADGWTPSGQAAQSSGASHDQQQQQQQQQSTSKTSDGIGGGSGRAADKQASSVGERLAGFFGSREGLNKADVAIEYLRNILKSKQSQMNNSSSSSSSADSVSSAAAAGQSASSSANGGSETSGSMRSANERSYERISLLTSRLNRILNATASSQSANSSSSPATDSTRTSSSSSHSEQPIELLSNKAQAADLISSGAKGAASQRAAAGGTKFSISDAKSTASLTMDSLTRQQQQQQMLTTKLPAEQAFASESRHQQQQQQQQQQQFQPADNLRAGANYATPEQTQQFASSAGPVNGTPLGGDYIEALDDYPRFVHEQQAFPQQQQQLAMLESQSQLGPIKMEPPPPSSSGPQIKSHEQQAAEKSSQQQQSEQLMVMPPAETFFPQQQQQQRPRYQFQQQQQQQQQGLGPQSVRADSRAPPMSAGLPRPAAGDSKPDASRQSFESAFPAEAAPKQGPAIYQAQLEAANQSEAAAFGGAFGRDKLDSEAAAAHKQLQQTLDSQRQQHPQQPHNSISSSKIYGPAGANYGPQSGGAAAAANLAQQQQQQQQPQRHQHPAPLRQSGAPMRATADQQQQPPQPPQQHQQQQQQAKLGVKPPKIVSYNYFEAPSAGESGDGELMATNYQLADALYSSSGGMEHLLSSAELEAIQSQFLTAEHPIVPLPAGAEQMGAGGGGGGSGSLTSQQRAPAAAAIGQHDASLAGLLASLKPEDYPPEALQKVHLAPEQAAARHHEEALKELASNDQPISIVALPASGGSGQPAAPQAAYGAESAPTAYKPTASSVNKQQQQQQQLDLDVNKKKKSLIVYLNHPRPTDMTKVEPGSDGYNNSPPDQSAAAESFVSAKEFDSHGLSKDTKHLDVSNLRGFEDSLSKEEKDGLSVVVIGDAYKYKKIVLLISSKSGGLKFIPMVKDMKK